MSQHLQVYLCLSLDGLPDECAEFCAESITTRPDSPALADRLARGLHRYLSAHRERTYTVIS